MVGVDDSGEWFLFAGTQSQGFKPTNTFVRKCKTILHLGEVNRIRELPQNSNIVATHADSPDILTGHKDNAEFALAMCSTEPFVLSGGKDKSVVLWSIHDHVSTLATDPGSIFIPTGLRGLDAAGRHVLAHAAATRLMFMNDKGEQRICKVFNAPKLPQCVIAFLLAFAALDFVLDLPSMLNPVPLSPQRVLDSDFLDIAICATVDTARHFIEASSWRLEDAMELFYVGLSSASSPAPVTGDTGVEVVVGGGNWQAEKHGKGRKKCRRPLTDVGNLQTLKAAGVKPNVEISRPVTRNFGAQLQARPQTGYMMVACGLVADKMPKDTRYRCRRTIST